MRLHPRATDETDRLRRSARTPFLLSLDCSVSAFIFASLPGGDVVAEARYRHLLVTCDVTGTLGDIALVTFDAMTVPLRPHRRATALERLEAQIAAPARVFVFFRAEDDPVQRPMPSSLRHSRPTRA